MAIRGDRSKRSDAERIATAAGGFVIIFDCNGVLVESERIAATVAAEEFTREWESRPATA